MKILHISDTHGFHEMFPMERFKDIDVVVHSGDCSNWRDVVKNEQEVRAFLAWYRDVPVAHKIYVAGNHDTSIERNRVTPGDFSQAGIIYLENASTTIDGIKFWGSPHTPTFGEWAFMKSRETIGRVWEHIPEDTDVLIVHGPPKGVRDLSFDRYNNLEFCGDNALRKAVRRIQPKLMLFGHIHDMDGVDNQGVSHYSKYITVFSNGACVDDGKFDKGLTSFGNILTINNE
jgi:Icc-related predicted phosphoesterase